jgi:hypothetical protein
MSDVTRSRRGIAARAAVAAALGLVLAGAASTPALAAESGVITQPFGWGYPTEEACNDQGRTAQDRANADDYDCIRNSSGTWDGFLKWYT